METIKEKGNDSVIKQFDCPISGKAKINLVKTSHFFERFNTRRLHFSDIIAVAEKALSEVVRIFESKNYENFECIIKHGDLNIITAMYFDKETNNISYTIITAIKKTNFIPKNPQEIIISV